MTYVKICGLRDLQSAICALEAGADMVGFVFAPSRRQVGPEEVEAIVEGCRRQFPPARRKWLAIGVFADQPLDFVLEAAARCGLDAMQLSGREPADYCRQVPLPLYRAVHVRELRDLSPPSPLPGAGRGEPSESPPSRCGKGAGGLGLGGRGVRSIRHHQTAGILELLREIKEETRATRLLLDSGGAGRWGGTGETFPWEWIGEAARDCLVAGGLTPGNVAYAIATLCPWGVDTSSGVETDGRKDPELIKRFISEVRRLDE